MCGILAYYGNATLSISEFYKNLKKIKNRGQDGLGICFIHDKKFNYTNKSNNLYSKNIIGHVRYTTSSKTNPIDQPFISENVFGMYSLIFNGNIPLNEYNYSTFKSDTLAIIHFLNKYSIECESWEKLLELFIQTFQRAYSLIIQTVDKLFVLRDKYGVRPLSFIQKNNYIFLSSESFIFDKDEYINEIIPGNILKITYTGITYNNVIDNVKQHCLFEYIYFLNKDSIFENVLASQYRKNVAIFMAKKEEIIKRDMIVVGVPNTGQHYSKSYAEQLNIPHREYITKNKNVSRTFIVNGEEERINYAKQKYIFNKDLKDKNIILIDDSVVRGLTMKILIKLLYEHGVNEIHIRVMSPPIINICKYGIDIPTKKELIYNNTKDIRKYLNCDSIKYFDKNDYKYIFKEPKNNCMNCLNDNKLLEW